MKYDLALDGGGSKLNGRLFDESFHLIASGRGGGVNTTQNDPSVARKSVMDCLAAIPPEITAVDTARVVFVGDRVMLDDLLRERLQINRIVHMGEAQAGLLAGSGRTHGLLALAGTGSDVFNIKENGKTSVVGAWGPIWGDQGSGAWIGLQAIRSVCRDLNGWGEKTVLTHMLLEKYNLFDRPFELVRVVHSNPSPFSLIASYTPMVGQAAREGDAVALRILRDAGRVMAIQMDALLRRDPAPGEDLVTLCGGAWKSHPVMLEAFEEELNKTHPELRVQRPWFEHVMAGVMAIALEKGLTADEAHELLKVSFAKDALS